MSRGALCWRTAPTRGSSYPTSRDDVRDDDIGELVDASVLRRCPGNLQGTHPEAQFLREPPVLTVAIPLRFVSDRSMTTRVLGNAEIGEDMPLLIGCSERGAALGVQQLPVETVTRSRFSRKAKTRVP